MTDAQLRRYAPILLFVAAAILLLSGLGAVGFWEPYEIRVADAARAVQAGGFHLGLPLGRPPLEVWAVAQGFSSYGVNELGGRLPIAVFSILAVLGMFYAAAPLLGRRAALWSGLVLLTSAGFLVGGRQIVSASPSLFALVFAFGGLWRALGPTGTWRAAHLLVGVAALGVGLFASGLLLGVATPLCAVAIALPATRSSRIGQAATVVATLLAIGVFVLFSFKRGLNFHPSTFDFSPLLGGSVHSPAHTTVFTQHLVKLGVTLFPWVALLPIAMVAAFAGRATPTDEQSGAGWVLIGLLTSTWIFGVVQGAVSTDLWTLAVIPAAMLIGRYIDIVADEGVAQPFAALAVLLTGLMVAHDLFAQPDLFVGNHLLESMRWPGQLSVVNGVLLGLGVVFSLAAALAIGVPAPRWATSDEQKLRVRRRMLSITGLVAVLTAMTTLVYVVPSVSKNMSVRDVYGKAKQLDPNAPLGQYRFGGTGSSYYLNGRVPTDLHSMEELFDFLGKHDRVFVMAGSSELASIDQTARENSKSYYVVDDSNSRFMVLSNQVGTGETDKNPLRRFVSSTPPTPRAAAEADFEGKIQLLGYEMPGEVERGQEFKVRLYFKVKQAIGSNYKIFMHFDGPGARFHGDHSPVGGLLPTGNWPVGSYVTDEFTVVPEKAMQPPTDYRLFMGFFSGDTRLKILSGRADSDNRAQLGGIRVK